MSALLPATVLVSYGGHGIVRTDDGRSLDARFRRAVGRPVCGDHVQLSVGDDGMAAVESIDPQRNRFLRADARGRTQVVAANLDRVLVVVAPNPMPSQDLLDRYLVAVHSLGIEPVVVVNKSELPWTEQAPENMRRLDHYTQLGYTVVRVSCKGEPGIATLVPQVAVGTSILVGQSGVGKSSLVRELLPDLDIQVGELSRITGKGTHTTTTTIIYQLGDTGQLIDSPGVWEYGLWRIDEQDLALGFVEFRPFLGLCRFNDCLHQSEPGCAIKDAVAQGRIADWRYASYGRLLLQNRSLEAPP
jgi:ribosome biogenesis GTPase